MTWKDDFHNAVKDYINDRYHAHAVEVTDLYDQSWSYDNSIGGSNTDYTVEITYKSEFSDKLKSITYQGRFSSLIEDLT